MSAHTSIEMANHQYYGIDNYRDVTGSKVNCASGDYINIPSSLERSYYNGEKNGAYTEETQGCNTYYIQTSESHPLSATLLDARSLKHRKRSRKCCIQIYAWLVSLTVFAFIAIILIGIAMVKPYLKVHGFIKSYCTVKEAAYNDIPNTCWCGKGCKSSHPCLQLYVMADTGHAQLQERNASLISENEISAGKVRI